MKKKEILIIFVLAVLATWGSGFIAWSGCGSFPEALCEGGWPLVFHRVGGIFGINQWLWFDLILDFLFWFLVLAVGRSTLKLYREKALWKKMRKIGRCGRDINLSEFVVEDREQGH